VRRDLLILLVVSLGLIAIVAAAMAWQWFMIGEPGESVFSMRLSLLFLSGLAIAAVWTWYESDDNE